MQAGRLRGCPRTSSLLRGKGHSRLPTLRRAAARRCKRSTGARTYRVEHNISEACEDPRYRRAPAAVAVLRVGDDEAPMLDIAPLRVVRVREGDIVGANVTVTLRSRPKSSVAIAMDVLALNPVYGAQVNQ